MMLNKIEYISSICRSNNVKRILLITGATSYKKSKAQEYIKSISIVYEIYHFKILSNNLEISEVIKGIKYAKSINVDIVIGIGGGKIIDAAKLIRFFLNTDLNIENFLDKKQNTNIRYNTLPLIILPTTVGSGSEVTRFAVVYKDSKKFSIEHDSLKPDFFILDSSLSFNLPKIIIATSALDAFCQAIESYWAVNSTKLSKKFAKKAMEIIEPNILPAVNNKNKESLKKLLIGANFAGLAIDISKTTAAHAISYPLTSLFGVKHGHAVALTIGTLLEYNYNVTSSNLNDPRGIRRVKSTIKELIKILKCESLLQLQLKIKKIIFQCDLPILLSELGIKPEDINKISANTNLLRLSNNPRKLSLDDINNILLSIY